MMQNNPTFEGALSWESEISKESEFILLEPGEYEFVVDKMERGQYQPSPTSSIRENSPQAELTLNVFSEDGSTATVFENIILHTKTEWKISEFMISIGQKIPGQSFTPDWTAVPGSRGLAKIEQNEYTNKNGEKRTNNRVASFLPPQNNQQGQSNQQGQTNNNQQIQQNQQPTQQQNANPGFSF